MSYDIRSHLKDREIKLRVDEETFDLIEAAARYHRTQKAVFVRDLVRAYLDRMGEEDNARAHTA